MANKIQVKRGVEANIPILDVGEPAFTTDTKKLFIGTDTGNMELATKEQINSLDSDINNQLNVGEKQLKSVITFIDDDGKDAVYTRLLPIFTTKNKKFSSAIITNALNTATYMTTEQLKNCHNTKLFETLSHTVDVMDNLTTGYTNDEIRFQLSESQKWLKTNGFEAEGFVYPQSAHNLTIRKMTREYYKYAFADNGFNNLGYLDNSRIKRIAFGSFYDGNPTVNGNSEKNTLAYYKACVEYAKTNNIWLIFMSHVGAQDAEQDVILGQLLDYIDSQLIEVVFPSEGYRLMGNKMSLGELEETHMIVGKSGTLKTNFYKPNYKQFVDSAGFSNASPITSFEKGVTSIMDFSTTADAGFPTAAGTLLTYRTAGWEGYSYQIWYPFTEAKTYKRMWDQGTIPAWKDWVWLEAQGVLYKDLKVNQAEVVVPSGSFVDVKFDLPMARPATTRVFGNPAWGITGTIQYNIMVDTDNKVTIRLCNFGTQNVTVTSRDWLLTYKL